MSITEQLAKATPAEKRALLARLMRERDQAPAGIARAPRGAPLPTSYAQRRLWFLDQLSHTGSAYNIPFVLHLDGPLDVAALGRALDEIVARHEILRTRFFMADGEPVQTVGPAYSLGLTAEPAGAAMAADSEATSNERFALDSGRLFRARLWRVGPERHRLLLVVHHIAFDGWSIGVLGRELSALYGAFAAGQPSPLPPLPIQYGDFAAWQRSPATAAVIDKATRDYALRLNDLPDFRLPADRAAEPGVLARAGTVRFTVPAGVSRRLAALGQAVGATPYMVLLTAFAVLLMRHAGQDRVVIGSPIAGRARAEAEGLMGFFVNSLVLAPDLSGAPSFREALARVAAEARDAFAQQDVPFERLVEWLQPERLYSRNPIFQVMFAYQAPFRGPGFDGTPITCTGLDLDDTAARFDLEGHVWLEGEEFHGGFIHNTALFDDGTAAAMVDHYLTLLAAAADDPDRPVTRLPLIGGAERALLDRTNATARPCPQDGLAALFADQVRATPEAVAVMDGDTTLTYAGLDRRANALALRLRALGVGPERVVAVLAARSTASLVAILAIVKAGGAYLAVDPGQPEARRAAMLADGRVVAVLHAPGLTPPAGVTAVALDEAILSDEAAAGPECGAGPDHLAYLNHTSGSTGTPKAVAVTQRAVVRLVRNTDYVRLGPQTRMAHLSSIAFDAATFEIWGALLNGGALVVIPRAVVLSAAALADTLARSGVTTAFLTVAVFNRMAEEVPDAFNAMTDLLFGGDAASPQAVARVLAHGGPDRLVNAYGPTETTTFASWHPVAAVAPGTFAIPIGLPIANTRLFVVEPGGEEAGIGVPGELLIGGDGVARGYAGAPAATAERFVPDAFGTGGRLYRTGDRVRRLADGTVQFIGRIDRQVKIRGFRIEPGEVEAALRRHPGVAEAAVAVVEDADIGRHLAAYVVSRPPASDAASGAAVQVEGWRDVFDGHVYGAGALGDDPLFNTAGWRHTHSGEPISQAEMRVWAGDVVAHALAGSPRRVLEVGCGTGMLLLQIAPRCAGYHGIDISAASLDYIRQRMAERPGIYDHVTLERRAADAIGALDDVFDTVLLSSVVQYFPSGDYLAGVIGAALDRLAPGGRVVLADLRSLALRRAFHTAVQRARATAGDTPAGIEARVAQALERDTELYIDPAFFAALSGRFPSIGRVELAVQPGTADNELTRFRYTAILTKGEAPPPEPVVWRDGRVVDAAGLETVLRAWDGAAIGWRGLPNARLSVLSGGGRAGFDPESLRALAGPLGWSVAVAWTVGDEDGRLDALFSRTPATTVPQPLNPVGAGRLAAYANTPASASAAGEGVGALRAHLAGLLPDYMLPAAIVTVDQLPLTAVGKIDWAALAALGGRQTRVVDGQAPSTPTETAVAELFAGLLGLPVVGATDDFFALGGHSLLSTRLVSRLRERFGVDLPLDAVFRTPTVAGIAARIDDLTQSRHSGGEDRDEGEI